MPKNSKIISIFENGVFWIKNGIRKVTSSCQYIISLWTAVEESTMLHKMEAKMQVIYIVLSSPTCQTLMRNLVYNCDLLFLMYFYCNCILYHRVRVLKEALFHCITTFSLYYFLSLSECPSAGCVTASLLTIPPYLFYRIGHSCHSEPEACKLGGGEAGQ